jgi:hypothetical protein
VEKLKMYWMTLTHVYLLFHGRISVVRQFMKVTDARTGKRYAQEMQKIDSTITV